MNDMVDIARDILEKIPDTRLGNGEFLNYIAYEHLGLSRIDFRDFKVESWLRARRMALSDSPELKKANKQSSQNRLKGIQM